MDRSLSMLSAQIQMLRRRMDLFEDLVAGGGIGPGVNPVADPSPDEFGGRRPGFDLSAILGRFAGRVVPDLPINWDPSPEDLGRFSKLQIETQLAQIDFARQQLDRLSGVLNERLKSL